MASACFHVHVSSKASKVIARTFLNVCSARVKENGTGASFFTNKLATVRLYTGNDGITENDRDNRDIDK